MNVTVRQLAEWVQGEVLGDPDLTINNARTLGDAGPGDITFVETDKNLSAWNASKASAAVVGASVPVASRPVIRVADPLMAFADIVKHLRGRPEEPRGLVHSTATVHPTARLATGVSVGAFAVIGEGSEIGENSTIHAGCIIGRGCKIGCNSIVYPRVVCYDDCILGDRVIVHAGVVLGADGFGYRNQQGRHVKIPQLGWVEIENDVEIGACSTIDRGTFGPTRIGAGTKIDNLVMVGHNCRIGKHNILCGQVGLAGSCTTGDYTVLAGQAGIADHINIGAQVIVGAKSGVLCDIPNGTTVFGYPAGPGNEQMRLTVNLKRIPEIRKDVQRIKEHLGLEDAE